MGVMEARRRILLNQPHLIDASGNPISFSTDMAAKMGVKAYFSPAQEGTGDPSPSNVRPITGWTGCEVTRCGKNLFNPANLVSGKYFNRNGTMSVNVSFSYAYVRVNAGEKIIFSGLKGANGNPIGIQFFDINKLFISDLGGIVQNNNTVYTVPNGAYYVGVSAYSGANQTYNDVNSLQLELGSTATAYEPYSGSTYPVTFPSEAGTLYGGYVDYERGEVVAEWYGILFNGTEYWNKYTNGSASAFAMQYYLTDSIKNGELLSNYLKTLPTAATWGNYDNWISTVNMNDRIITGVQSITTVEGWKEYLAEHNLFITYRLEIPVTYPLTPQIIKSLKGVNTIWSDTNGNVSLKYWKH